MEGIKILHTADVHLKDKNGEASAKAFADIIALAKRERPDVVLIAGDLFDSGFESRSEKSYMVSLLGQIPDIPVFMIAGNHDSLPCYRDITLPPNVHMFGDAMGKVSVGDTDIYGVSMSRNYSNDSLLKGFHVDDDNRINILLLHGDLDGSSAYNPFTSAQLSASGVDYAALGHVHTTTGVCKSGATHYAYAGVPQGRGFDELGNKGVWLGRVYKGHVDLKQHITCSYTYEEISLDVSGLFDYGQIADKIKESIKKENCYKIHLTGSFEGGFSINADRIINLLEDYSTVKIYDETGEVPDIDMLKNEQSLRGFFVKRLINDPDGQEAIMLGLAALDGKEINIG